MTWPLLLIAAAAVNLVVAELFDWCPWLAERLIRRSVRKLPPDVRERYLDEWLAELEAVPGRRISLLIFAALVLAGASKVGQEITGSPRNSVVGLAFKRTFDGAFAFASLFWLAPILVCVALAVRLSSRGPVLSRSMYRGVGQRPFARLRFRTLYSEAEYRRGALAELNETPGSGLFRIRNDPRITPVGRLLRRSALWELPQLLNVLRGEMSLVGPHPLHEFEYKPLDERQHKRYSVKPGLTGLAQLHVLRGSTSAQESAELDIYYVDHRSLWLDLKILALTPLAILGSRPSSSGQP